MFKLKRKKNDISLTPIRTQVVSIDEFLRLYEEKGAEIQSTRILPPRLGSSDFGRIIIEWKNPVYVAASSIRDGVFA